MAEKGLATQPAKEISPFKFAEVEKVLRGTKEIYDSIARRAFELFEGNGRVFGRDWEDWFKAEAELLHPVHIKISETAETLNVEAEVPGFSEKELEVSVEPHRLTIIGKSATKAERKEGKTVYSEQCSDQMLRVIDLPAEVETGKITATLRNGVLEFAMPKAAQAKKVRVEPQSP